MKKSGNALGRYIRSNLLLRNVRSIPNMMNPQATSAQASASPSTLAG
jgi:hypothetical protein